jgi:hypothetical protein
MDAATFIRQVCKQAGEPLDVRDPLAAAELFLVHAGETAEGELLRRCIDAVAFEWGTFNDNEIWLLSQEIRKLIAALFHARIVGQYLPIEWARTR